MCRRVPDVPETGPVLDNPSVHLWTWEPPGLVDSILMSSPGPPVVSSEWGLRAPPGCVSRDSVSQGWERIVDLDRVGEGSIPGRPVPRTQSSGLGTGRDSSREAHWGLFISWRDPESGK